MQGYSSFIVAMLNIVVDSFVMYSDRSLARSNCAPINALFSQTRRNIKTLTVWLAEVWYACEKHIAIELLMDKLCSIL